MPVECPYCNGVGGSCVKCNGKGFCESALDAALRKTHNYNKRDAIICSKCRGKGGIMWRDGEVKDWEVCDECVGTGIEGDKVLFKRAIKSWGEEAQIKMAIEECGELIVKLAKLGRFKNGSNIDDVIDEIADVSIMMAQLRIMFGDKAVDERKRIKLDRLRVRLDGI